MTDKKPTAELIAWLDKEIESGKSLLAYENGDAFLEEITNENAHLQAIKDRLAELEAALTWQPIETAPKPSGNIILAAPNGFGGFDVANGHWYKLENEWAYDCHFPPKRQPTHWRPFPLPPNNHKQDKTIPNVDPKGTTRFADEATLKYIADLEGENRRLLDALNNADILATELLNYVDDYSRKKWDFDGDLRKIKQALQPKGDNNA